MPHLYKKIPAKCKINIEQSTPLKIEQTVHPVRTLDLIKIKSNNQNDQLFNIEKAIFSHQT